MASLASYLKAENLKMKRTFARKLIIIAPVCILIFACIQMGYFALNLFNWWYTLILPGVLTLMAALVEQHEGGKLAYRALDPLPVDLRRVWLAKILLADLYAIAATGILIAGLAAVTAAFSLFGGTSPDSIGLGQIGLACLLLILDTLWQIPLCVFLSRKLGMLWALLINIVGGTVAAIACATQSFWWACPWSWTARLMVPAIGVLPSGLLAETGDPLLATSVLPVGIVLLLAASVLLLILVPRSLASREVN